MTRIMLAVIAVLMTLLGATGFMLKQQIQKVVAVEQQRDAYKAQAAASAENAKALERLANERERKRIQYENQVRVWRKRYEQEKRSDKACAAVTSIRLPDCIVRLFREDSSGSNGSNTASVACGGNPCPGGSDARNSR